MMFLLSFNSSGIAEKDSGFLSAGSKHEVQWFQPTCVTLHGSKKVYISANKWYLQAEEAAFSLRPSRQITGIHPPALILWK